MKKWKLLTWKNSSKILKVKAADKVVELQEDRSLFALMMIVYKSWPEVDIKEADTDVLVLAIRRYPELCMNTSFVTGRGESHGVIDL